MGVVLVTGITGRANRRLSPSLRAGMPAVALMARLLGADPPARGQARVEPLGKRDAERDRTIDDLANVQPLVRASPTAELDTRAPLDEGGCA